MRASTLLIAVAIVAAPGIALSLALFPPGRTTLPVRLALVVPFGYGVAGFASFVLVLAHALTLPAFLVVYASLTAASWGAAVRRHGLARQARAIREEVAGERWPYALGLLMALAMVALRLTYSGIYNLFDQTPLRYWADGLEIADAHRIPALTLQWGHLFPSTVSKVLLNSFDAAASLVLGRGPVAPMGALLFVVAMGIVLGVFALARELGLGWTAPILVLFLFAKRDPGNQGLTADLSRYKAENVGRMLMIVALVLVVRALRARNEDPEASRREALIGGALFGMLAATHLVPFAVGLAFAVSYAMAQIVLSRKLIPTLRVGGVVAVAAAVLGVILLFAPRGDIGFQGTADTAAYRQLARELGQPTCWDPTLYLAQKYKQACRESSTGFYAPPSSLYREFARRSVEVGRSRLRAMALPLGYVVALGLILRWGSRTLRPMAIAATVFAVLLLLVSLYFSYRYHVYAIAQFGERRLFDYAAIPATLMAMGVIELLLARVTGWARLGASSPRLAPAAALVLLVLVGTLLLPKEPVDAAQYRFLTTALGPLNWLERNVPCQGRILADRRTLATFETFTRHTGVLEGMGPYLRPTVLSTAIRAMFDARQFFLDPLANEGYLRSQGIWAVVVTAPNQPLGGALKVASLNHAALKSAPFLRQVARSASMTVYRFTGYDPASAASFPSMAGRPGYECGGG